MQMVLITALGVGSATIIGALIGFMMKRIPHRFNDAVLGFAARHLDIEKDIWLKIIENTVPPKTVEINKNAFLCGYEA